MKWFKRKKKHEDIDPSLLTEDDFYIGTKKADNSGPKPHSLTADEITGDSGSEFYIPTEAPLESLRKKIIARNKHEDETPSPDENCPHFFVDTSFLEDTGTEASDEPFTEIIMVPDSEEKPEPQKENGETEEKEEKKEPEGTAVPPYEEESLLKNCLPFIMDGNNGEYKPDDKPAYTLDSVASILGIEEPETDTEETDGEEAVPEAKAEEADEKTMVFKKIDDTDSLPDISDIDTKTKNAQPDSFSSTATMPVIIPDEMISATRDVELPHDAVGTKAPAELGISEEEIKEEYNSYTPEFEFNGQKNRKKVRKLLLSERRKRFIKFFFSIGGLIILGFLGLPTFSDSMLSFNTAVAVFTSIGYLLPVICNYDVLLSLPSLLTKRTSAETGIALSVILSTVAILISFVNKLAGEVYYGIALMTVLSLVFRSYFLFRRSQYVFTNFSQVAKDVDKYGITLIDDAPTTFAMARKAIDGDVLIAAPRRTRNVTDFIKNSTFDVDLDGRARILFIIGLATSLLAGAAFGFYRNDFSTAVVTACAFAGLFAPLTTIACSVLPLSSAASHLHRYGAVLTGLNAAKQIEAANACVIDCDTLFPKGSIKLVNMKVLAPNNLEETIACACAITANIKSPLAPIFKEITETNKSVKIPVADSIKYEERMGITGWIGNKRIFIGNRALMLAHEIPIGDAEKDKKLMRDGYFPVYVACDGKPYALLVLKYIPNPTIAKELDRISAMGLTILVNNCDQNLSEEMICDYFDLYGDSVKIMSGSGVHMYRTAASYEESMNAGAVIKRSAAAMAATVYCSNRVKKAHTLLQIAHIISIVLGVIVFSYVIFGNLYVNCTFVALYQLACFILSGIAYLFTKP